jgi:hypothetical protein
MREPVESGRRQDHRNRERGAEEARREIHARNVDEDTVAEPETLEGLAVRADRDFVFRSSRVVVVDGPGRRSRAAASNSSTLTGSATRGF